MPHYTVTLEIARPIADVFAFLATPKNLVQLAPPDLHLELVTGPELMVRGAQLVWKGRRWGVSQNIIQEVATFESDKRLVVEQKKGPFTHWTHAHQVEAPDTGTRLHERIDFEPPSGLLGRLISADFIRKDL